MWYKVLTSMLQLVSHGQVVALRETLGLPCEVECSGFGLSVEPRGPGRFLLSGSVAREACEEAALSLWLEGQEVQVPLAPGMTPLAAFRALERRLPSGFTAAARPTELRSDTEVLVTLERGLPSAARIPDVRVTIHDPSQTAVELAVNSFQLSGFTACFAPDRPWAALEIDSKPLCVLLARHGPPLATARAIAQALPLGYRAIIDPPQPPSGGSVVVTVVHASDTDAAAA